MLKLPAEVRERYDISSTRVVIHAAAPCPVEVKQKMMDWFGPKLFEFYSCTEVNRMTVIGPEEWLAKPGSVGRAVLGRIHICDDDGTELKPGETGAVYFERDVMPFVYHNRREDPRRSIRFIRHGQRSATSATSTKMVFYLTDRKSFSHLRGVNITSGDRK
jgi:fatty-acyl-CoA synthase